MLIELIRAVARSANISDEQARLAVTAMLRFLAARLPSPLVGEIQRTLKQPNPAAMPQHSTETTDPPNDH